jgi:hypothetical protein
VLRGPSTQAGGARRSTFGGLSTPQTIERGDVERVYPELVSTYAGVPSWSWSPLTSACAPVWASGTSPRIRHPTSSILFSAGGLATTAGTVLRSDVLHRLGRGVARATATFVRRTTSADTLLVPSVAFLDDPAPWNLVLFLEELPPDLSTLTKAAPAGDLPAES